MQGNTVGPSAWLRDPNTKAANATMADCAILVMTNPHVRYSMVHFVDNIMQAAASWA